MKKYAVITGASSGIGKEFAKRLSKQGYHLILVARRKERLEQLAKRMPTECEILCADLTSLDECERVYGIIRDKNIELFINNAGFGDCGSFSKTDLGKELDMLRLNIMAVHYFTKRMVNQMRQNGHGSILNVASSAGLMPAGPYMATYYATKAYVASFTRSIAEELREESSPVYIGCLCPGPVKTEFNKVANVEFSLNGISAGACVSYALSQMRKQKVLIIPKWYMKAAAFLGRLAPEKLTVRMVARQQKRKFQ